LRKHLAANGQTLDINSPQKFDNDNGFLNGGVDAECFTSAIGFDVYNNCPTKVYQLRAFCTQAQVDAVMAKEAELYGYPTPCGNGPQGGTYMAKFYTDSACTEDVSSTSHSKANSMDGAIRPESMFYTNAGGSTGTNMEAIVTNQLGCRQEVACDRANSAGQKASCYTNTYKTNITAADTTITIPSAYVGNGNMFSSSSVTLAAGDLVTWVGWSDCDESNGIDTKCSLDHWKAKLGMAMCQHTDTGDWSGVCVTVDGTEHCATDCTGYDTTNNNILDACFPGTDRTIDTAVPAGTKTLLEQGAPIPLPMVQGNTATCTKVSLPATDTSMRAFSSLQKICGTNDYKCNNGATCAAAPAGADQCNPTGTVFNWYTFCDTTMGPQNYELFTQLAPNALSEAFALNCVAGASPFSDANPLVGMTYSGPLNVGTPYDGNTIAATSKCQDLYTKMVLVPAPAAAPSSDSFAASSKSFSLVTMLVASVLAIFSFRG
jgi:hypothetical protein